MDLKNYRYWNKGFVITVRIPKKGHFSMCDWAGISLLSIPAKVFCKKFILDRLVKAVDSLLYREQAGFDADQHSLYHIGIGIRMAEGGLPHIC